MSDKNKVKYGVRNAHYAKLTIHDDGTFSYGPVMPWPGSVSLSLDAEGDANPFYADDSAYFVTVANNGYSGDFESALVPDDFNENVMGNASDENGVQLEDATRQPEAFALLFEFEGDKKAIRHVLYNCKMTRSSVESSTTEDSTDPQTETGTITASPLVLPNPITIGGKTIGSIVKGKTTADTEATVYQNWYNAVYVPGVQNPSITSQPSGVSVAAGATATFTVAAEITDSGALSYQWQSAPADSNEFSDISGAATTSYTTPVTTTEDNGKKFRVAVTNTKGGYTAQTYSGVAVLTVVSGG